MVAMYIYFKHLENWLNTMRFARCLAMGSDRIIAKSGNSLLGLSLNWCAMTQRNARASLLYFETFFVRKLVDLKNHRNFLRSGI